MSKHIIKNYEQVKAHLTALSRDHNKRSCDYYFAVGDLFNENVAVHSVTSPDYVRGDGVGMGNKGKRRGQDTYQHRVSSEIRQLLKDTNTDITLQTLTIIRATARAWPKKNRTAAVSWSVYRVLAGASNRLDLIQDGMTHEAALAARGWATRAALHPKEHRRKYNRTQTIRIGINCLRSVADNDDGSALTEEQIALIGEAYAVLDDYCERKGVSMTEPLQEAA